MNDAAAGRTWPESWRAGPLCITQAFIERNKSRFNAGRGRAVRGRRSNGGRDVSGKTFPGSGLRSVDGVQPLLLIESV